MPLKWAQQLLEEAKEGQTGEKGRGQEGRRERRGREGKQCKEGKKEQREKILEESSDAGQITGLLVSVIVFTLCTVHKSQCCPDSVVDRIYIFFTRGDNYRILFKITCAE